MRFKFLFGHKDAACKPRRQHPREGATPYAAHLQKHGQLAVDTYSGQDTLIEDFDQGNDDVTAIRSSLGLEAVKRLPASE